MTTPHTDFDAQRQFRALTPEDQLLQIWLNGRETNGSVADVIRDVEEIKPKVLRHERWMIGAAAIGSVAILAGPGVFFVLGKIWS